MCLKLKDNAESTEVRRARRAETFLFFWWCPAIQRLSRRPPRTSVLSALMCLEPNDKAESTAVRKARRARWVAAGYAKLQGGKLSEAVKGARPTHEWLGQGGLSGYCRDTFAAR
jgi:hypothetical protein